MPEMLPIQVSMTDCPECGSNGKTVKPVTVEALVTGQHFIRGDWWCCA